MIVGYTSHLVLLHRQWCLWIGARCCLGFGLGVQSLSLQGSYLLRVVSQGSHGLIREALLPHRLKPLVDPRGALRLHGTQQTAQIRDRNLAQPGAGKGGKGQGQEAGFTRFLYWKPFNLSMCLVKQKHEVAQSSPSLPHLSNTEVISFCVHSGLAACRNPPMLRPP